MIQITFTEEQINQLHHERYAHPHPRVQQKIEALYLKSMGLPHQTICAVCRITRATLVGYLKIYCTQGIDGLKTWGYRGGLKSGLKPHAQQIEADFAQKPPHSIAEAITRIKDMTGVERSATSVKGFMAQLGMKYRKTGFIPKGADCPEKQREQEDFKKKPSNLRCKKPRLGGGWSFS